MRLKTELLRTPSSPNLGPFPLVRHELREGLEVLLASSRVLGEVFMLNVRRHLVFDCFEVVPINTHFCEYD